MTYDRSLNNNSNRTATVRESVVWVDAESEMEIIKRSLTAMAKGMPPVSYRFYEKLSSCYHCLYK